jgi:hypothetical protein
MVLKTKQVVLIIGAGASRDLHEQFALGEELLNQILDRVTDRTSDTHYLSNLLDKLGYSKDLREDFVRHLDKYKDKYKISSKSPSIDGFIEEVSSFPKFKEEAVSFTEIAKFAIMFHILGYEGELKNSSLKDNAWIHEVAKFIDEKKILENAHAGYDLKIITFNYDRTIEHYLYNHDRFKNNKKSIKAYIKKSIIHVYGKTGDLDWQSAKDFFEFGEQNDRYQKIHDRKKAIMLMSTKRTKSIAAKKAAGWIKHDSTKMIGAFGFGFDPINCELLFLTNLNDIGLIANIYPSTDNKAKREMEDRIRTVQKDAGLTYLSCTGFLTAILNRDLVNE